MDAQINRWAQKVWDLCRVDELYQELAELRQEARTRCCACGYFKTEAGPLALEELVPCPKCGDVPYSRWWKGGEDGQEEQQVVERHYQETGDPRQLELFADGEGQ